MFIIINQNQYLALSLDFFAAVTHFWFSFHLDRLLQCPLFLYSFHPANHLSFIAVISFSHPKSCYQFSIPERILQDSILYIYDREATH